MAIDEATQSSTPEGDAPESTLPPPTGDDTVANA